MRTGLILNSDKERLLKIRKLVEKHDMTDETHIDYECADDLEALDRAIYNLENGANYFRAMPDDKEKSWFHAECEDCRWSGSSRFLLGGHQIADTGDYSDAICPICGSKDVN